VGRAPTEGEVAAEVEALLRRDALDERQTQRAADAELIDTTHLTQDDQVARIVALARKASRG
jgi:cytidylate kinase